MHSWRSRDMATNSRSFNLFKHRIYPHGILLAVKYVVHADLCDMRRFMRYYNDN